MDVKNIVVGLLLGMAGAYALAIVSHKIGGLPGTK